MSASTGHDPAGASGEQAKAAHQRGRRELARSGAILVLAGLIIAFAVANLGQVEVDWLVGSGRAPLIIVIVISLLVGMVVTHLAGRLSRRRR